MSRILVVDDKEPIREVITDILSIEHEIIQASNGEEAITILTEQDGQIDLVILDVNMPVADGWETLRVIRDKENGWPDLSVVMLTVRNEPESVLKAWEIGATYYCTKPFSMSQILETVNKALFRTPQPEEVG